MPKFSGKIRSHDGINLLHTALFALAGVEPFVPLTGLGRQIVETVDLEATPIASIKEPPL